jgi:DNA-binding NarL/FixJ family response regulator
MNFYSSQAAVLVAAEPTLYRTGLVSLLSQQWPSMPVTLTADMSQVVDLVRTRLFQLLILDDYLPNHTLLTLLNSLRHACPTQKVIVLTPNNSLSPTVTTSHLLVPRYSTPAQLAAVLNSLLKDNACQPAPTRTFHSTPTRFSPRELEILRLVVEDNCNLEIASHLHLSVRTVESHRRALLQKSGTRTLAGLVAWALRTGMIA